MAGPDLRRFGRFGTQVALQRRVLRLLQNCKTASLRSWTYGIICDMHPLYEKANAASDCRNLLLEYAVRHGE